MKRILSIDIDSHAVRAVVVQRRGRRAHVLKAAEAPLSDVQGDAWGSRTEAALTGLLSAMGNAPRRAVIVSRSAFLMEAQLPVPHDARLSPAKLVEAVKWEVETFLSFPASEGHFRCERLSAPFGPADASVTRVLVSGIARSEYEKAKTFCRGQGLVLQAVCPAEAASGWAVASAEPDRPAIALGLGPDSGVATLMRDGNIQGLHTFHISPHLRQDGHQEVIEQLRDVLSQFRQDVGDDAVMVLDGHNDFHGLGDALSAAAGIPIAPWGVNRGQSEGDEETCGAGYARAVGAALHELGVTGGQRLGLDDRVPLLKRLKQKIHALPILAIAAMMGVFGVHYGWIRWRTGTLEADTAELKKKREELESKQSEFTAAEARIASSRKKAAQAKEQGRYLTHILPARHQALVDLLQGIVKVIPDDVILAKIEQIDDAQFRVNGCGRSVGAITEFAADLQKLEVCARVRQPSIAATADDLEKVTADAATAQKPVKETARTGPAAPNPSEGIACYYFAVALEIKTPEFRVAPAGIDRGKAKATAASGTTKTDAPRPRPRRPPTRGAKARRKAGT